MSETTTPDYTAMAHREIAELRHTRGEVEAATTPAEVEGIAWTP